MPAFNAEIPEIVRANRKDEEIIAQIRRRVQSIALSLLRPKKFVEWNREIQLVAEFFYFGLTTGISNQTIGEEYLGLIQSEKGKRKIPSATRRWIFVFLQVFGAFWSEKILQKAQKLIANSGLEAEKKSRFEKLIGFLRKFTEGFNRIHLALFYVFGNFYHFGKRLTGVRYFTLRSESSNEILKYFRYLGYFTIVQSFLAAGIFIWSQTFSDFEKKKSAENSISSNFSWRNSANFKCLLCFEFGRPLASTFCGHVFCWNCLQETQSCPICRFSVAPNRIVPLMNF